MRAIPWLETLLHDFRYATRMLANGPGFTLVLLASAGLMMNTSDHRLHTKTGV